jgi:hypothetical protein
MESSPSNHLPMNKNGNNYKTMVYCIPEETKITEKAYANKKSTDNHEITSVQSQILKSNVSKYKQDIIESDLRLYKK